MIGNVEGVGSQDRVGLDDVFDLAEFTCGSELLVFKNRLDHEINALEIGGVGGRGDARQQGVAALLCGAAPLNALPAPAG